MYTFCGHLFAGQIHEMNEAWAVSVLDKELFVLPSPTSTQLNVYDAVDYTSHGFVSIPIKSAVNFVDITACSFYHCFYLADAVSSRMIRLQLPSKLNEWKVGNTINAVSVTSAHYLLVLCGTKSKKLNLFTTDGVLHMTVELQPDLVNVSSAVELMPGRYVVTHGRGREDLHRVCVVDSESKVLHAYGGFPGSYHTLLNCPTHVAVDNDGFVYVAEQNNNRLTVFTPTLDYIHCINRVLSTNYCPFRQLKIDKELRRMYVRYHYTNNLLCRTEYYVTMFEM